jgi:biotin transport system permease protein
MIGVHLPGRSPVHRLPAGPKLLLLIVAIVGITVLRQPWQLGLAALLVLGVVALSRLPWRAVVEQVWSLRWLLLVLAVVQVLVAGWQPALMLVGGLVLAITLAAVVTLTTSVTAILDLTRKVAGPLRRSGWTKSSPHARDRRSFRPVRLWDCSCGASTIRRSTTAR